MRYIKINCYIFSIELCEDSKHNENRLNIVDKLYATYTTNKFKIIEIENMVTTEIIDKYYNYKVGDIICKTVKYYLTKERAFFEIKYDRDDIDEYKPIDKLYYIKFFTNCGGYSGLHRSWYDSGQLQEEFYQINGNFEGLYREYFENGSIKNEYYYINNKII
jgi:antitoxin component YwqK of YwqJK toxin-antitoxin module